MFLNLTLWPNSWAFRNTQISSKNCIERFEENSNCRPIVNEIASIQGLAKINQQEELARTRINQFSEKIKQRPNFDENLKLNASFDNPI